MTPAAKLPDAVNRALALRDRRLSRRSVHSIAASLGALSRRWLRPGDRYRLRAIDRLVRVDGYAAPAAEALLDRLFESITEPRILRMLAREMGDPRVLDEFTKDPLTGRIARATGPELITHFLSGNLPSPAVTGIVCGLLVKSVNALKLSARDAGVTDLYLRSLRAHDRTLAGACVRINASARDAAVRTALASGLAVVTGSDETIRSIRERIGAAVPVIGYGHRFSAALLARESLTRGALRGLAERTARDVWMAEQRGCLSCVLVEAERGGECAPEEFAERLAAALRAQDARFPGARRSAQGAREKAALRFAWKVRRSRGEDVRCFESDPPGRWQVLYENRPSGTALPAAGEWTVLVRAFGGREWERHLMPHRAHVQAAALEARGSKERLWSERLARMGFSLVTRPGRLQSPPLDWRRDGLPVLSSWVRWTDREGRARRPSVRRFRGTI